MSFAKFMISGLSTYIAIDAVFVAIGGLALKLPWRSWGIPFGTLLFSGLLFTTLLYWTRQSYGRPKVCAQRFALTILVFSLSFMMALLVSAIKIGILSESVAANDYAPYALFASVIGTAVVYFGARKKLQVTQESH